MLDRLSAFHGLSLLALRLFLGAFLIWGVWDNIVSAERMAEFERFLAGLDCPLPHLAAPLSVWAQLLVGGLLIPGLLTRPMGLLLSLNFAVAVWLLFGAGQDFRQLFPPTILIFVGLVLATGGAGPLSIDWALGGRRGRRG
jgi:putative oxidoreductase